METGKYLLLWKHYLPVIRIKLKQSLKEQQLLNMNKQEFLEAGDRNIENYSFKLEIQNGKIINNIGGTAVARDLFAILSEDKIINEFFKDKRIKINMGITFTLKFISSSG